MREATNADRRSARKAVSDRPRTPSSLYDKEYFLTSCEGYERFDQEAKEGVVSPRLAASLRLANAKEGERILDVGCGRGEAALFCGRSGASAYGVDYSADAVRIAQRGLNAQADVLSGRVRFLRADARQLPFEAGRFDKLLMFDVLEHLYPWEVKTALREAERVLTSGGELIIHTAPNRWYYKLGYPLYRSFERLRGRRLPRDPRDRFPDHHLHVNEQDILRLRRALHAAGFESEVWLENVSPPSLQGDSLVLQLLLRILLSAYPFRWIFRNDIFATGYKKGRT